MKALHCNLLAVLLITGAFSLMASEATVVVNSLLDTASPGPGEVTLRSALAVAADGEPITFAPGLDGGTIELSIVGEEHCTLVGEVMFFTNGLSHLVGYYERDYGRSALYTTRDVVIDASSLPNGITFKWMGGDSDPARVLAVYGNLTLKNVSITGGRSVAIALPVSSEEYAQKSTRARGGALAVWGVAQLDQCRLYGNTCYMSPFTPGRYNRYNLRPAAEKFKTLKYRADPNGTKLSRFLWSVRICLEKVGLDRRARRHARTAL